MMVAIVRLQELLLFHVHTFSALELKRTDDDQLHSLPCPQDEHSTNQRPPTLSDPFPALSTHPDTTCWQRSYTPRRVFTG